MDWPWALSAPPPSGAKDHFQADQGVVRGFSFWGGAAGGPWFFPEEAGGVQASVAWEGHASPPHAHMCAQVKASPLCFPVDKEYRRNQHTRQPYSLGAYSLWLGAGLGSDINMQINTGGSRQ